MTYRMLPANFGRKNLSIVFRSILNAFFEKTLSAFCHFLPISESHGA
jgi:hypothetical protein